MTTQSQQSESSLKSISAFFNQLALLAVCGTLIEAFFYQFAFNELPCPLCQLQRVALILVGLALLLNVKFGASTTHYAMILVASLVGAATSLRQVLLHIAPNDAGYGSPFLGIHFYTWGFIFFVGMIAYCAVMLIIDRNNMSNSARKVAVGAIGTFIIGLFFVLAAANTVSSVMVCKFGPCPDNPTEYAIKF